MNSATDVDLSMLGPAPGAPTQVGRYRVCCELASGGMASVFLGIDEAQRDASGEPRPFAIKRVHPHLARQRAYIEMFSDEARIAARIRHPNVCAVLESGEADGTFYLVMELLQGEPLVTLLRRTKRKPELLDDPLWARCAARLVADACAGLHAAHEMVDEQGEPMLVVHRDISPHNVFVTWQGEAKVVDFGVASAKHRLHHTTTGTVKGKFAYMSPEHLQGLAVDRRSDVWSLGVVLWELVTARPLFRRSTESETIFAVMQEKIPAWSSVRPAAPTALEEIARRALRFKVDERTPSARAMQVELEAWLESQGGCTHADVAHLLDDLLPGERESQVSRTRAALAGAAAPAPAPVVPEVDNTPPLGASRSAVQRRAPAGRKRWMAVGVALGLFLSIGGGAAAWVRHRETAIEPEVAAAAPAEPRHDRPGASPEAIAGEVVAPPEVIAAPVVEAPASAVVEAPAAAAPIAAAPTSDSSARARRAARAVTRPEPADPDDDGSGVGTVDVSTPGGWAEVWLGDRRLGHTPGRFDLPAGRHTLVLRPGGDGEPQRAQVRIVGGQLARLRVDLAR